ncbi:TPA: hypothetical protein R4057_003457 [Kluyvera ascorbata]|uniref:hypothetical protein n=1 Tax=Kluyvera ascorbata TaxID=51288 RepID=UPI0022E89F16|nr:hypothetical protein [Kluyvera ascorbata]MEB6388020.1 hypothetical protein [Kluyvera ascorbata]HED3066463.1 hypothetical protein [Kluyvera ascorbata]
MCHICFPLFNFHPAADDIQVTNRLTIEKSEKIIITIFVLLKPHVMNYVVKYRANGKVNINLSGKKHLLIFMVADISGGNVGGQREV